MDNFTLKEQGLERLANKLRLQRPTFDVLKRYVVTSGEAVAGGARTLAPVNNGPLRASINAQVIQDPTKVYVESSVGSNLSYTPYMEYGTGLVHDHPNWGRKRHVLSYKALMGWARNKLGGGSERQVTAFAIAVAKKIMKRGGLLPRRFLRGSLERLEPRITADAQRLVADIKREAGLE